MADHHRCNICGRDFTKEENLREHVDRRHPEDDKKWWLVVEDPSQGISFERKQGRSADE